MKEGDSRLVLVKMVRRMQKTAIAALFLIAILCASARVLAQDDPECDLTDPDACAAKEGCVWCKSAAVGDHCYATEEAKSLPASIFDCAYDVKLELLPHSLTAST